MTDNNHPITPPPELVQQWLEDSAEDGAFGISQHIATKAARWGSDQELEACCKWLPKLPPWSADDLRKHRRPQPSSLKDQALQALKHAPGPDYPNPITLLTAEEHALVRRALEQLDD